MAHNLDLTVQWKPLDGPVSRIEPRHRYHSSVQLNVNIVKQIMSTTGFKNSLLDLAIQIDRQQVNPWYKKLDGDNEGARQLVGFFLSALDEEFPLVVIDEQLSDPASLAHHFGIPWSGIFEPAKHAIHLNASVSIPLACYHGE